MKPILLGVNIDHIATLRQSRLTQYPDPVEAAIIAEQAGVDSITIHLREDRRHIQDRDIFLLKDVLQTPMNLEMALTKAMLSIAEEVKPEFCCLVPESREELTTEGGLDVASLISPLKEACSLLKGSGIRVSLFIDADPMQIEAAREVGATVIEIHTGHYADAEKSEEIKQELQKVVSAVDFADNIGLQVNAGHGLNCQNIQSIASIENVRELNIGHSIVSRAVFIGLEQAVKEVKRLMLEVR